MTMLNADVFYVSPLQLIPYENNAKIHDEEQIEQIAESIRLFGFNDPIGVDENNNIIEGHGRVLAAIKMGLDKVPVFHIDGLTDQQKKAYMLVHNQLTSFSPFDNEILQRELSSITEFDMEQFSFAEESETYFDPQVKENPTQPKKKMVVQVKEDMAYELRKFLTQNKIKFKEEQC